MITKITSDNDLEFYAPRFQQITEALAMETEETRNKMIEAVSAKINLYAPISDSTMAKANTYLQEVISNKKARSANRDILINAYESALIEHSFDSLMALQQADIKAARNDLVNAIVAYMGLLCDDDFSDSTSRGQIETFLSSLEQELSYILKLN